MLYYVTEQADVPVMSQAGHISTPRGYQKIE